MKSSKYYANARNTYPKNLELSADTIKAAYPSEEIQPATEVMERGANLKELIQQRDEALKVSLLFLPYAYLSVQLFFFICFMSVYIIASFHLFTC